MASPNRHLHAKNHRVIPLIKKDRKLASAQEDDGGTASPCRCPAVTCYISVCMWPSELLMVILYGKPNSSVKLGEL
jgi:hypothetical protein